MLCPRVITMFILGIIKLYVRTADNVSFSLLVWKICQDHLPMMRQNESLGDEQLQISRFFHSPAVHPNWPVIPSTLISHELLDWIRLEGSTRQKATKRKLYSRIRVAYSQRMAFWVGCCRQENLHLNSPVSNKQHSEHGEPLMKKTRLEFQPRNFVDFDKSKLA